MYDLKHGKHKEQLIEAALKRGAPLPDFIQNAPTLDPTLEPYLVIFDTLCTARPQSGFGVSPIPWHVVDGYATRQRYTDDEANDLWDIISYMDRAYIKAVQESKKDG